MKKIEAIIKTEKFGAVKDDLAKAGFTSLTAYEVKGRGKQSGVEVDTLGSKIRLDLLPKTKVEVVVEDSDVAKVVDVIVAAADTKTIGAGKIFVSPIEDAVRIRTRETGKDAI
jgi:nitrogen regulatory protein P-II 1